MATEIKLRSATEEDAAALASLIQELAEFEHAAHEAQLTAHDIAHDGFGPNPAFVAIVAERESEVVGMALLYDRYSTWKGRTLYLEDLIVTKAARGQGIGSALLRACQDRAEQGAYKRLEWQVLDWNKPAIDLYTSIGAELDGTWINCRLNY